MPKARNKRSRDYESGPMLGTWEGIKTVEDLKSFMAAWMRDLKAWGGDVRDDIIRLEAAVGAAPGEPGDPPPAPRG